MSYAKKIANRGYEEEAAATSATWNRHGIGRGARRVKRLRNRAAKRAETKLVFKEQEDR